MPTKVTISNGSIARKTWSCKGKTLDEVFKNLNKHGWWGRYRSNLTMKSTPAKTGLQVKIAGKPIIIMPKWSDYSKAAPADKKSWDSMYKALLKHETNHHSITEKHLKELKTDVEKNGEMDKNEMLKAWNLAMKQLAKKQETYDSRTDHGSKEGVML
jgi:predicted secreted Zn-dependent protease